MESTFLIQGLVSQRRLPLELLNKFCEPAGRNKKLQVGLLIDIAFSRTPTKSGIVALHTIHRGLRVDGEAATSVHRDKVVRDATWQLGVW
jgi:hypothetical protein